MDKLNRVIVEWIGDNTEEGALFNILYKLKKYGFEFRYEVIEMVGRG
ncbi:MAG: hypothetical protein AB1420_15985 [Bacillota bacterium]